MNKLNELNTHLGTKQLVAINQAKKSIANIINLMPKEDIILMMNEIGDKIPDIKKLLSKNKK